MTKLTGVGGVLCVAHCGPGAPLHGHTYEVVAWYRHGHDACALHRHLAAALAPLDHTTLPPAIQWAEDLAEHIGKQLPGCYMVEVNRNPERIFARWVAPGVLPT